MTEEVNGVTLQLPEDGHVGFPTAMSGDASDPEFYLRKSVVRPSAPVRPFARPPVRQPVRPSAHCPPVRLVARPLGALVRLCARPLTPSAPSASYHPWSLAYKFFAVEAKHALCLSVSQDCGFSLEDPLRETHCIGGHPHWCEGMVLFWTTMWFFT